MLSQGGGVVVGGTKPPSSGMGTRSTIRDVTRSGMACSPTTDGGPQAPLSRWGCDQDKNEVCNPEGCSFQRKASATCGPCSRPPTAVAQNAVDGPAWFCWLISLGNLNIAPAKDSVSKCAKTKQFAKIEQFPARLKMHFF